LGHTTAWVHKTASSYGHLNILSNLVAEAIKPYFNIYTIVPEYKNGSRSI